MPSWNIHTAHVERLLAESGAAKLGIADVNAFLFGNYVPDIYLGFLVPDTSFRLDYRLTHLAKPSTTPVPDADRFRDEYITHPTRKPKTESGMSLALGAWAHLIADRTYNERFRAFCETHDTPTGDELREAKQADFALFGNSLAASSHVRITPDLLEAAHSFRQYSILPADVERAVKAADLLLQQNATPNGHDGYQLLSDAWMRDTFEACHERLISQLAALFARI